MSLYYPQAAVLLRVRWENFGLSNATLDKEQDIMIRCKNIVVDRNDYSEADEVKLSIDYSSFPFDPRCIRACGITVYMDNVFSMFDGNKVKKIVPSEDNTVFIGFADESSIKLDSESKTVMIEGRDYTSLFIDQKRVNTDPIPLSKPVDQIIQDLINEQEATKKIKIVNRTGGDLPTLAQLAPDYNHATSVKNVRRKETYWDIMQDILGRVALLGFIELDKFVISKPQNIYEKKDIKQFVWGKNIKDIEFKRKLGRAKNFNVKVISFNQLEKKVETALIPEEATDPNIKAPRVTVPQFDKDGKKVDPPKEADFVTFNVKDVTSKEQLIKIGESIFQEMSRQQIEGSLTTFEMEVPEEVAAGKSVSYNPIKFHKIRNGTAIRIFFTPKEAMSLNKDQTTLSEKTMFLVARGYPRNIAQAFAESLDRINTAFYTRAVSFELDQDNGFSMKLDFINFIDLDSSLQ